MEQFGKWLILAGAFLVAAGLLFYFGGEKLGWLGNLPGDIKIEKENLSFYFPITTMILISLLLTLIVNIVYRLFRG